MTAGGPSAVGLFVGGGAAVAAAADGSVRHHWVPRTPLGNGAAAPSTQRATAVYLGFVPAGTVIRSVRFFLGANPSGAGQAEVAIASSPTSPNGASPTLTVLAAGVTATLTSGGANVIRKNAADLAHALVADTHLWGLHRGQFATSQGTTFLLPTLLDLDFFESLSKNSQPDLTTLVGSTISTWTSGYNAAAVYLAALDVF